jgi:hypothetical protein
MLSFAVDDPIAIIVNDALRRFDTKGVEAIPAAKLCCGVPTSFVLLRRRLPLPAKHLTALNALFGFGRSVKRRDTL